MPPRPTTCPTSYLPPSWVKLVTCSPLEITDCSTDSILAYLFRTARITAAAIGAAKALPLTSVAPPPF